MVSLTSRQRLVCGSAYIVAHAMLLYSFFCRKVQQKSSVKAWLEVTSKRATRNQQYTFTSGARDQVMLSSIVPSLLSFVATAMPCVAFILPRLGHMSRSSVSDFMPNNAGLQQLMRQN
jgi:hypothetical protein